MIRNCMQRLLSAALFFATAAAQAQPAASGQPIRPDPADPAASAAPLLYRSAFEAYREARPATATGWLEANREVAAIGGWKAYSREAQAPEPAASATTTTAPAAKGKPAPMPIPTPAPHDHGSHKP